MPKPPAAEAKASPKTHKHVTMRIDHKLWRDAKIFAFSRDTTVSALVADSLRAYLAQPNGTRRPQ